MKKYLHLSTKVNFIKFCWLKNQVKFLYFIRNDKNFLHFCTKRNDNISYDNFIKELKDDFMADRFQQYIITDIKKEKIGTAYLYSYNKTSNKIFFSIFIAEKYCNCGYSVGAVMGFLKLSFSLYSFKEIFFDVYEQNAKVLKMLDRLKDVFKKIDHIETQNGAKGKKIRFVVCGEKFSNLY